MKLYFSPNACSMVPHIVLEELALPFTLVPVNLKDKTYSGGDFRKINSKGQVPTLELDSGDVLTENSIILQYLAGLKPEAGLLATTGIERFHQLERLNFLTTDIHKNFTPLFNPSMPAEGTKIFKDILKTKFTWIDEQLKSSEYISGKTFGLADAYLFVMTSWASAKGVEISACERVLSHHEKMKQRPSVEKALKSEKEFKQKV
ncbi:MAG: glutathione transferase GstA [Proteobacteria bacterium]|nr:MAG: glutathione transferase GstA [Pseudomonadota bacterium]